MEAAPQPVVLSVPPGVPQLLRDLVHQQTGIFFAPEHFDMMLDKLRDRAIARGCGSYLDYYYILKYYDAGRTEWLRVMDAFSVQETYFWREASQLRALVEVVVPAWFRENPNAPLHIWSAACATGEEPYSISIALHEAGWGGSPIVIQASDASEAALAKARAGVYRERSFRSLSPELRRKYFEPLNEGAKIRKNLLHPVAFSQANIVFPGDISGLAKASVIFCRNVFIYFSPEAMARTANAFAEHMPPNGHLFIGASESLLKLTDRFEVREIADAFVYVKKPARP